MYSVTILLVIALMGGIIAYVGDKLGTKIGKKRITVMTLRPKYSSILIAVLTGMLIAIATVGATAYISEDVRTALFGMEKIKAQLHDLSDSVNSKNKEIEFTQSILSSKNKQLADVDRNIAQLSREKQQAEREALEAGVVKQRLQKEIEELNVQSSKLRENIKTVRQGQIIFQAGEVVGGGVLKTGLDETKNQQELERFLGIVNNNLVEQLRVEDKNIRILQVGDLVYKELLTRMKQAEGSISVRLLAGGNLVYGDPIVAVPQILPYKLLYSRGELVYEKIMDLRGHNPQQVLLDVLNEVNAVAISKGAIPDPLTGMVGNIPITQMLNITGEFQKNIGSTVKVSVFSKQDTYVADSLLIDVVLEKVNF